MPLRKPFKAVPITVSPEYRVIEAKRRRHRSDSTDFTAKIVAGMIVTFVAVWIVTAPPPTKQQIDATAAIEKSVYYAGCNEARAAGAAPIYAGQPGYRPEMDGDSDGIACEPYRSNGF